MDAKRGGGTKRDGESLTFGELIDLVLSEYGAYTLDLFINQVTPAQLFMMARAIVKRKNEEAIKYMTAVRIAFNANQSEFEQTVNQIRSQEEIKKQAQVLSRLDVPGFKIEKKSKR